MARGVQDPQRGEPGGIAALADLLDAHRGAFEHDWRARFGLPLTVVGTKRMTWGEALRLTQTLAQDTTSQVCAALAGWDYLAPREALVLMDLYDAFAQVNFKKPKPYPRPWSTAAVTGSHAGDTGGRSRAEVVAYLNSLGHHLPEHDGLEVTDG